MKRINLLAIAMLLSAFIIACDNEDDVTPDITEEETESEEELNSWLLVGTDSFFVATARPQPGTTSPYRYQINFATRDQLSQTNNDGGTASTFALVLAFENRPTAPTTFTFTDDRFTIGTNELNLYQSWFINTGHPNEDKNFISQAGSTVDLTIENNTLTSSLDGLTLFNEGDNSETIGIKWQIEIDW